MGNGNTPISILPCSRINIWRSKQEHSFQLLNYLFSTLYSSLLQPHPPDYHHTPPPPASNKSDFATTLQHTSIKFSHDAVVYITAVNIHLPPDAHYRFDFQFDRLSLGFNTVAMILITYCILPQKLVFDRNTDHDFLYNIGSVQSMFTCKSFKRCKVIFPVCILVRFNQHAQTKLNQY